MQILLFKKTKCGEMYKLFITASSLQESHE